MFLNSIGTFADENVLAQGTCDTLRSLVQEHKEIIYYSTPIYEIVYFSPQPTSDVKTQLEVNTKHAFLFRKLEQIVLLFLENALGE